MPKQNYKNTVILSALEVDLLTVLIGKELYGLELLETINEARHEIGMNELKIGSLYPTLKRLETAGLIKGKFQKPAADFTFSRRKYYKLSHKGQTAIALNTTYRKLLAGK